MIIRFNMDKTYIPETSIYEQRDLMFEWEESVKYGAISAVVTAAASFLIGYLCCDFGDWYEFPQYIIMIALLVGSKFAREWKYPAYWVNVAAFLVYIIFWLIGFKDMGRDALIVSSFGLASGSVMSFFNLKCIRNFYPVFKELEKCKGFPSFIANTADLYGEKLYLKDEDVNESDKFKASHNPFNTKEDIKREEFARSQKLKSNYKAEAVLNIGEEAEGKDSYKTKKSSENHNEYEYGFSILGIDIIFPHNHIPDMSFEEKKGLMFKWNNNVTAATGRIVIPLFLMFVGTIFSMLGGANILVGLASILLLIIGTNNMKMGNLRGGFITLFALGLYTSVLFMVDGAWNGIPGMFILVTSILNLIIAIPTVRFLINHHIYRQLSTQEGFPSFIRTNAQKYGKELYIIEEEPKLQRKEMTSNSKIVMDIGYDEKPKNDEGAWNAFNYMDDKNKENEINGDENENNG